MEEKQLKILHELKSKSMVSTGGTEVVSVAYSVACAKKRAKGELKKLQITVDSSVFKNGLNVVIPGCEERGLDFAAALGYVCQDTGDRLGIFSSYGKDEIKKAKELLAQGKIHIKIKNNCDKLFIECLMENARNLVRVVVRDFHQNIFSEEITPDQKAPIERIMEGSPNYIADANLGLSDFLDFAERVPVDELDFIREGLKLNLALGQEGQDTGLSDCFSRTMDRYHIPLNFCTAAHQLCMRACEARIRGSRLPVMTMAGSTNYGIVIYLSNYSVGTSLGVSEEKILRAIALSSLMSIYANSYVGSISAICDCSFAVGIGVTVGIVYLLNGGLGAMERAVKTVLESITGILCDGDKLKCAWKLGLTTDWAVKSALLAMESEEIGTEGFLDHSLEKTMDNISQIYSPIADTVNQTIVDLILGE